jgi:hypothetical protein
VRKVDLEGVDMGHVEVDYRSELDEATRAGYGRHKKYPGNTNTAARGKRTR